MSYRRGGNSLAEYLLPLALVLVVALPVLQALSAGIQTQFKKVLEDEGSGGAPQSAAIADLQAPAPAMPNPASDEPAVPIASSLGTNAFSQYASALYPASPSVIETVGVNGYTKSLADYLMRMAMEAFERGDISETQFDLLVRLANQGHRIARLERIIEEQAAIYGDNRDALSNHMVEWEGQMYTVKNLAFLVDSSDAASEPHPGRPDNLVKRDFQDLYKEARWGSGKIKDPAIAAILDSLSGEIGLVANEFQDTITSLKPYSLKTMTPEDIKNYTASGVTDKGSKNICHLGSAQDSGVHCGG